MLSLLKMYVRLQCFISLFLTAYALPTINETFSVRYLKPNKNIDSKSLIQSDALTQLRLLGQSANRGDESRLRFGNPIDDATKYPYLVSIQIPSAHMFAGVAVIISKYWVLTTAENVEAVESLLSITHLVSNSLDAQIDGPGILHDITRVTKHENFVTTTNANNVGVMRACPPFTVIAYANLPAPGQLLPVNTEGYIAAWAADGSILYDFSMVVDDDSNCVQTSFTDAANQFCNVVDGPSPICETADTGTPWFVNNVVVGLANSAHCTQRKADVFVDVAQYVNWIKLATEM